MDVDELNSCSDVLGKVAQNFLYLPEQKQEALQAGALMLLAQRYIVEIASHMSKGMDTDDALRAAAMGELAVSEGAVTVFALLADKAKGQ